jgi:hypothetical protein
MIRLRDIAGQMSRLESSDPTTRELELRAQYPRIPRERVLRLVAAELVDAL